LGTLIVVSSLSDILIDKYKTGKIGCGEQITGEFEKSTLGEFKFTLL